MIVHTTHKPVRRREEGLLGQIDFEGLSRLWHHVKTRPFAVLTAFRGEHSLPENRARNRALLQALNEMRMGPHMLGGVWVEAERPWVYDGAGVSNPDTGEEITRDEAQARGLLTWVSEESYFVPKPGLMSLEEFRGRILQILQDADQDGAVFSDGRRIVVLQPDGSELAFLGTGVSFRKVGDAYSWLRNRPDVPFVFEGSFEPINIFSRMGFKGQGLQCTWGYR